MTFEYTADLWTGPSSKLEVESRNRGILSPLTLDEEAAKGLLSFACTLLLYFADSIITQLHFMLHSRCNPYAVPPCTFSGKSVI